jgi:hypothetical protein
VPHPAILRRQSSFFWPWRRSSPLRLSSWRGGSGSSRICRCTRVGVGLCFTRNAFHSTRRCTSSVQFWTIPAKPLRLMDECIVGAAAADILGDVGISSLARALILWIRPAFRAWRLSFPPTLILSFPLLFTSARTEAKPDVLEKWTYMHFSITCASIPQRN